MNYKGKKYNRLICIEYSHISKKGWKHFWKFKCDCGNICISRIDSVLSGAKKSCGCLHTETARIIQKKYCYKHGKTGTKVFNTWVGIRQRCNDNKVKSYKRYGARGIKVCKRWELFENFYQDMGDPPSPQHSIDRINNNGNYYKKNCRWATPKEQAINRNSTSYLTFEGRTLNQREWAKKLNISYKTLNNRLRVRKWTVEKTLTTPLRKMINNRSYEDR